MSYSNLPIGYNMPSSAAVKAKVKSYQLVQFLWLK